MFHTQGTSKYTCRLLVVVCGRRSGYESLMISSGCMEVRTVVEPSKDEFCGLLDSFAPNIVYLLGEHLKNDEVGSLVWQGVDLSSVDDIARFFGATLPSTVYLEASGGEKLAEALSSKGIPYVIYWNKAISCGAGSHFSQALFSVLQSSMAHIWDAFQLGRASFRLYCIRNNLVRSNRKNVSDELGPYLLGEPPKINVPPLEKYALEGEESSPNYLPAVNIHHDEVSTRFLICGAPSCKLDSCLLESLEDGLNALLNIEMRESKLHNRFSVPSPPLLTEAVSHGVVAMQCELSTSTSAHISLLVSGGSQICFDDGLLESHIKNEIIENSGLIHALPNCEGNRPPLSEPRKSASIACGATVFEIFMNVPRWALQVLRQLAREVSFRSLVVLGIASIQGLAVASFEKDDTERLLLCCSRQEICNDLSNACLSSGPSWLRPPAPSRKRSESCNETSPRSHNSVVFSDQVAVRRDDQQNMKTNFTRRVSMPLVPPRKRLKVEAMMPIPRIHRYRMLPFSGICWADSNKGNHVKPTTSVNFKTKHRIARSVPTSQRKSYSSSFKATQFVSLNPLPLKKHDCGRSQIPDCSEEEFLKDLMDFLILRGHRRLIPQGGLADFPDVVLNAKRLDLYNLYKEVVSRGGFLVGNGINWKGQIFSKMRNHTITNKMTGVGNVLKRHYETYLLEYELAHDDIDRECCLLCGSGAAGDWVNCGMCGEWAHFGCDTRQGLGAFKDYAKTDGLEYVCPPCSHSNY